MGAYLGVRDRMWDATRTQDNARRLRRRAASRAAAEATAAHRDAEAVIRDRWARLSQTDADIPEWAETVAGRQADTDPRVTVPHKPNRYGSPLN